MAKDRGWSENWLNDALKNFLSPRDGEPGSKELHGTYPDGGDTGLRVFTASPRYLIAMKAMAMRMSGVEVNRDEEDVRRLAEHVGVRDADDVMDLVSEFYPDRRMTTRARKGVAGIFGEPRRPENQPRKRRGFGDDGR